MTVVEFGRTEIERLLDLLDQRLKQRGVSASVYVVGGAAIAVTVYDARRTVDVEALVSDPLVLEEARQLADAQHRVRQALAIDDHGECATDARVPKFRFVEIEAE